MVSRVKSHVCIVGGGPAGLASAIALRLKCYDVTLIDYALPSIDKACGEGVTPDGVRALKNIGVSFLDDDGQIFRGIRFIDGCISVSGSFCDLHGFGVSRLRLHKKLLERAKLLGVAFEWGQKVTSIDLEKVYFGDHFLRYDWLIGADGFFSKIRLWGNFPATIRTKKRIGLRQHYKTQLWSDFVEVYCSETAQAYVTPVGSNDVCVALVSEGGVVDFSNLDQLFPELHKRLAKAEAVGDIKGGVSQSIRLPRVTSGKIALVGDASSSIDAITGEGLSLAFRQAEALSGASKNMFHAVYDGKNSTNDEQQAKASRDVNQISLATSADSR